MIVLDASVLIAHFSSLDVHHDKAVAFLRSSTEESLLIHPVTLAEVLVGATRAGVAAAVESDISKLGVRIWLPDLVQPRRVAALRVELTLKLPDCYVLDTAESEGAELATFDAALKRAALARRVRVLPE